MATTEVISTAAAQKLILDIARGYGWISQSAREASDPEALEAIKTLQQSLGISTLKLATNLYKSKARFVFELVQNAEDNVYTRATANGAKPYLKFTVYPNKIVIDSNENGFTAANVNAICKIGESTKTREGAQQFFIGQKGIGFKSVFMVASKVHIQSGPFSFSFQHFPDEGTSSKQSPEQTETLQNPPKTSGMGLVTPVWEPAEADLPDPSTRMTLTLLPELDHSKLLSQFDALPDNFLLFLNKLSEITIEKHNGTNTETTTFSRSLDESCGRVTLTKVHRKGSTIQPPSLKQYHITRKTLTNLSPDEHRDGNTAEVVLAFPLDNDEPIISPQQTYCYLPMGNFGFSFLIQSDFVTDANREGVVEDRQRNFELLDGIAETFLDAVLQFCNHPTLQYKWPRYIPQGIPSTFWKRIEKKIHELLKDRPVLRGQSHGPLRPISQLKKVGDSFKHHGKPLVADLDDEMYLASEYHVEDIAALERLGLGNMEFSAGLPRLQCDLGKGIKKSKFKSTSATDDWHTSTAKLLLIPFERKWTGSNPDGVRKLPCIPLNNGRWTAITDGDVYFPRTEGILIPDDLGLRIVDEESSNLEIRKKLFIALGVEPASLQDTGTLVLKRYDEDSDITFEKSLNDLQFLYSAHSPNLTAQLRKSNSFFVFDFLAGRTWCNEGDLYLQSDEEYSFEKLIGPVLSTDLAPRGQVGSLIHPDYCKRIELPHEKRSGSHPSFKTWLQNAVGVLNHPRLVSPKDPTQLSPVFQYIIKERPEKLLGTLKAHWASYAAAMSTDLASTISEVIVPSSNIGPKRLKETFIPSKTLLINCGKFVDVQKFPFLKLENGMDFEGWKFLKAFHVGIEDNLDFWLQVLYNCKSSKADFQYKIYEIIQQKIWMSDSSEEDMESVRDFVNDGDLILAPSCTQAPPSWTSSGCCLWDAPDYFTSYIPLLPLLSRFNTPTLTAFFQETLDIEDVSWVHFISELNGRKLKEQQDVKVIQNIYLRLQEISAHMESKDLDEFRSSFEEDNLIYDMVGKRWSAPSACLWSKDAQVPGKSIISGQYSNLETLFVKVLKVKIPDLHLLVKELKRVARCSPSIDIDIKSLIWQINAFNPTLEDLKPLHESKVLPVRKSDAALELRTRLERFSIVDRQPWADAFKGKLDFLDFSLKDVRTLQPFLSSMDVGGYLSEVVVEKSSFEGFLPEPSHERTRNLRRRAYALSRCATHFHSPRAKNDSQDLYQLFLKSRVYETDGIIGTLEHKLLGETVPVSKTNLHIEESREGLQIYIPKDSRNQEICYLRLLPTKIFNETMMAEVGGNSTSALDSKAVSIITAILASSDKVVDMVLEEAGIVPVPYPDQYEEEHQQSPDVMGGDQQRNVESDIELIPSEMEASARFGAPSTQSTNSSTTVASAQAASYQPRASSHLMQHSTPLETPAEPFPSTGAPLPFRPGSSQVEYRRLLDNIITAARKKRGAFPSQGAFNLDELLNALPVEAVQEMNTYDLPFGVRSENQLAHDMKIGAAGELYAFELLSRLDTPLPGFDRGNWQSTIRKYVKVHENYEGMTPWKGSETADITYDDKEGEFTKLLISNGYLDESIWASAKPMYFLEVKATTKGCATRLFLSKAQHRRMGRMRLGNQASKEVYIILRVFNLGTNNVDMRLYVDPAGMEDRRELEFTSESWSVVPGNRDGD